MLTQRPDDHRRRGAQAEPEGRAHRVGDGRLRASARQPHPGVRDGAAPPLHRRAGRRGLAEADDPRRQATRPDGEPRRRARRQKTQATRRRRRSSTSPSTSSPTSGRRSRRPSSRRRTRRRSSSRRRQQFQAQLAQYQDEELFRVFGAMKKVGGRPAIDFCLDFARQEGAEREAPPGRARRARGAPRPQQPATTSSASSPSPQQRRARQRARPRVPPHRRDAARAGRRASSTTCSRPTSGRCAAPPPRPSSRCRRSRTSTSSWRKLPEGARREGLRDDRGALLRRPASAISRRASRSTRSRSTSSTARAPSAPRRSSWYYTYGTSADVRAVQAYEGDEDARSRSCEAEDCKWTCDVAKGRLEGVRDEGHQDRRRLREVAASSRNCAIRSPSPRSDPRTLLAVGLHPRIRANRTARSWAEPSIRDTMSADPNKKSARTFQCRDVLWETFEQMARELECSIDYLINESMKQYARQRSYSPRTPFPGGARDGQPGSGQHPMAQQPRRSAADAGWFRAARTAADAADPLPGRSAAVWARGTAADDGPTAAGRASAAAAVWAPPPRLVRPAGAAVADASGRSAASAAGTGAAVEATEPVRLRPLPG